MKLTKEALRDIIKGVITESKEPSMLLTEVTWASAKDKINNQMLTFAVFSTSRGERSARENRKVDLKVREYLKTTGYPWTVVEGGYKETPRDETGAEIPDAEQTSEIEKSYLIFEQDTRPDMEKANDLFSVANEACRMSQQESFSFGYPRMISDPTTGEEYKEMFIAIYPTGAKGPGPQNHIKQSWAGPYSSIDKLMSSSGYYTKVRGTKGSFMQEAKRLRGIKPKDYFHKRELRHKIQILEQLSEKYD